MTSIQMIQVQSIDEAIEQLSRRDDRLKSLT